MERGMTQYQLARVAGYTERLVRKAEKGGRLDVVTIRNLAGALSMFGQSVSADSLCLDNLSIAKLWVKGFDNLGDQMWSLLEPHLSDEFAFYCSGNRLTTPFAGTFNRTAGLRDWLQAYFAVIARNPCQELEFTVGTDTVVARWLETGSIRGVSFGPIRISMYFRFQAGLIIRMDKDYDTRACEDAIRHAMHHSVPSHAEI